MKYTARTDVGLKRENNEDNLYARIYDEENALFVVCDGLGGYSSGEVASKVAVNCIRDNFEANIEKLKQSGQDEIQEFLVNVIQIANEKIFNMQVTNPDYKGMGTTVVLVAKINNKIYYESVGDSRLYYIDSDKENIEQVTVDDTYVNELVRKKIIDKSEAKNHPQKHVLTKALGIFGKVDTKVDTLIKNNGLLLLCSDGLTNMVKNDSILDIIKTSKFETTSDALVDSANRNGGADNVTVIVIEI